MVQKTLRPVDEVLHGNVEYKLTSVVGMIFLLSCNVSLPPSAKFPCPQILCYEDSCSLKPCLLEVKEKLARNENVIFFVEPSLFGCYETLDILHIQPIPEWEHLKKEKYSKMQSEDNIAVLMTVLKSLLWLKNPVIVMCSVYHKMRISSNSISEWSAGSDDWFNLLYTSFFFKVHQWQLKVPGAYGNPGQYPIQLM